ncbi:MAG TPA: sulfate ABC transporter substrate-binding protein [Anaerolineales bacterium]|jgi:sulfate transport system substrate-binding protein|nr:sulfate ABC transporter substrate-binding protein [Anaerolineales bacterium]
MFSKLQKPLVSFLLLVTLIATGCSPSNEATQAPSDGDMKLTLAGYTTPREAYAEIIPLFQADWKEKTGQTVTFEESYQGSGAQSRAVVEGFEADVVALSLEADVIRIEDAGLITHDWRSESYGGIVSTSVVAFAVREGNPKNIQDWADLAQSDLEILTPNPKTSGGAMWNVLALYGAAKRGNVEGISADDTGAQDFLLQVLKNVSVMDKGARESITTFEKGVGDVAITYENEVLVGQQAGINYELVLPTSTIRIDNPVAVVDTYVDKHGTREVAEAFVDFLFTKQAQEIFAKHGLRSPDPDVATATSDQYPPIEDLFTIDDFGGWGEATPTFFGDDGIFYEVFAQVQGIQISD